MEVLLLGSGGPRGWPEPACTCASCSTAASLRTYRAPACALVDDVLLLDGPAHADRDLSRVRHVLLTGTQEPPPQWLDAVGGTARVQLLGPPAALERYRSSDERVQLVAAAPGDRRTAGAHEVRAWEQGAGVAWEVVGPQGGRLLHAPGGGPVRPGGEGAYDVVLLGLGASREGRPGGLAPTLAQLRRDGLVQPTTDVRAVGYDHDAVLPDVLQHHLSGWGVGEVEDGALLTAGAGVGAAALAGRTLVLGGVRSGKSALAEQLLAAHPHVTYVATGGSRDGDAEWQQRVAAHRVRRPASWRTVETTDLTSCLRGAEGAVLVDCLGTWLTALLDRHGVWAGAPTTAVEADVDEMLSAWRASRVPLVAVSNEVGSGVVPATPAGRLFRDLLGRVNAQVAAESETVLLTVAGIPLALRAPAR